MYAILVREYDNCGLYSEIYGDTDQEIIRARTDARNYNLDELKIILNISNPEELSLEEIEYIYKNNPYIRKFSVVYIVEI